MVRNKSLFIALSVITLVSASNAGQTTTGSSINKPPSRPLPSLPTKPKEGTSQNISLAQAQIEMLKEASRVAEKCHSLALETAARGSKDPQKFKETMKERESRGAEKSIFPDKIESIFAVNPKFCSETVYPEKMDRQSFVSMLKVQKQTTKTMFADISNKILDWTDVAKIESYKQSISGDLRALSSFCVAPLQALDKAIDYKNKNSQPVKKKGFLSTLKDKMKPKQN